MNESSLGAQARQNPSKPPQSPYSNAGGSLQGLADWHRSHQQPVQAQPAAAAGELPRVSTGGSFV